MKAGAGLTTFKACKAGAHGKLDGVPIDLTRNTEKQSGTSVQRWPVQKR